VSRADRQTGIDLIRGVVMVLMAIDHVRLYGGVPAGGDTAGVFFTRWVTHFCAPVFVFLAGTSAFLYGRAIGNRPALSRFLLTRGVLLVVLELTVVKFSWGFNLNYAEFTLAGVIWMIGWCMVLLSLLVRLSARALGLVGVAIIVTQPVFAFVPKALPSVARPYWEFIYPAGFDSPFGIDILYVIVPWIGVMAAGYGFGLVATMEPERRRRWCLRIGLGAVALFLGLAAPFTLFADSPPDAPPRLFRVLNQQKYPASLPFLLMTLGPAIALLPLASRAGGWLTRTIATFGRVPMFYYLLHIPAIHLATLATAWLRGDGVHHEWYRTAPYAQVPPDARWTLGELYLVFAIVVIALYFPCAWYARLKARPARPGWTSYI
jgi:uncharacterized membrane protein